MKRLVKACTILKLGKEMQKHGSWLGETHIQKATYFLQELLRVPLEFEFILYKHGPFSFDFREFLTYMASEEFIFWRAQPPYGPSLRIGEMGIPLMEQYGSAATKFDPQIEGIASWLGKKNVSELERVATALYVTTHERLAGRERVSRIMQLKPHINAVQSNDAVTEIDAMMSALSDLRLD